MYTDYMKLVYNLLSLEKIKSTLFIFTRSFNYTLIFYTLKLV